MKDIITETSLELDTKSPFVCVSCGHPHDIKKLQGLSPAQSTEGVKDRFTEAMKESGEKSAFVCESCGHEQAVPTTTKH